MHTSYNDLIEKYVAAKNNGMSLSEVRRELKKNKFEAVKIDYIISAIDNRIYEKAQSNSKRNKSTNYIFIGVFLLLVTCGLYFLNLFKVDRNLSTIITYGPSLSGVILILKGINEMMSSKATMSKFNKSVYFKK